MRILAIDTATEACSVALFDGAIGTLFLQAYAREIIGRGHAERLVPMIADLPQRGRADLVCVSLGPGSFTGLRIGIAAARALGIAWNCDVLGFGSLALVAALAVRDSSSMTREPVTVCMNGGHGEWFVQNFDASLTCEDRAVSLIPEIAAATARHDRIAGNRAIELADRIARPTTAIDLLPDARAFGLLNRSQLTDKLAPIYGRAPDARPQK